MASECAAISAARLARNRALGGVQRTGVDLPATRDTAPALYARSVPRTYALLHRAQLFARSNNELSHWTVGNCWISWMRSVADDSGSMTSRLRTSLVDRPMRLTATVDHHRQIFRGQHRRIVGWARRPKEERVDMDGEWVLTKMPQAVYLHFHNATWTVHADDGKGVNTLTTVSRTWEVNKETHVKVQNTGFFLVPNFASTAHMVQGLSLEAALVGIVTRDEAEQPTDDIQVASYVVLSRARDPDPRRFLRDLLSRASNWSPCTHEDFAWRARFRKRRHSDPAARRAQGQACPNN